MGSGGPSQKAAGGPNAGQPTTHLWNGPGNGIAASAYPLPTRTRDDARRGNTARLCRARWLTSHDIRATLAPLSAPPHACRSNPLPEPARSTDRRGDRSRTRICPPSHAATTRPPWKPKRNRSGRLTP